jgi:hypothetical protein
VEHQPSPALRNQTSARPDPPPPQSTTQNQSLPRAKASKRVASRTSSRARAASPRPREVPTEALMSHARPHRIKLPLMSLPPEYISRARQRDRAR